MYWLRIWFKSSVKPTQSSKLSIHNSALTLVYMDEVQFSKNSVQDIILHIKSTGLFAVQKE